MKKTFLTLLMTAVAVWSYVLFQFLMLWMGRGEASSRASEDTPIPGIALLARPNPRLDTAFRDPFQSYLYAQKPVPVAPKTKAVKAPPVPLDPPHIVVNGILWSDSPVAILKQGDKTELVKAGQDIWDIKVVRIERNQVVVVKQGHQFILGY